MTKTTTILILFSIFLPLFVFAQTGTTKECCILGYSITVDTETCDKDSVAAPNDEAADVCEDGATACGGNNWGMFCFLNSLYRITDWISYLLFAFVGVMIIFGAFTIVTAGGDPQKVTSGKNYILYAIIGLVVALFARAIPALVKAVIGM